MVIVEKNKKKTDRQIIHTLILSGFFALTIVLLAGFVYAAVFVDNTQAEFQGGTYSNTIWNTDHVELSSGQTSGTYTSRVFDAGDLANWSQLAWSENLPSGNKIFIVDNKADIWKSIDNGITWIKVNDDYNGADGDANSNGIIADTNGNIFILDNSKNIWKSINSGATWTKAKDDYNEGETNNGLFIASDGNNLYIAEADEDIWKSSDGGANWSKIAVNINGGSGNIKGFVVTAMSIYAVDVVADVWKSSDSGVSWILVDNDYNGAEGNGNTNSMAADANGNIFILNNNRDVWKSSDDGATWAKIKDDYNGGEANNGKFIASDSSNNLYITEGDEDVWESSDGGVIWTKRATDMNTSANGDIKGISSVSISTDIVFSVRSGDTNPPTGAFSGSFTNPTGSSLGVPDAQYFQYQATFSSGDAGITPKLYDVTTTYSIVDTTPPVITRVGDAEITVEAKTSYIDDGATAFDDFDDDITANIITVNPVDVDVVGDYTITYNVSDSSGNAADSVTRTVHVVDTTAPVITVLGSNPQTILVGEFYVELGATAIDSYDGDITINMIIDSTTVDSTTVGSYVVTYNITDAHGNLANQAVRAVNVIDTDNPIITMIGANPQTIEVGNPYTELGATASDNYDGDITSSIVIDSSSVDTNTIGSYVVAYDVTDSNGNTADQVVRTVHVVDTTAPVITVPDDITEDTTDSLGKVVTYTEPTATDTVDGSVVVVCDKNSGDNFLVGTTTVNCSATDTATNTATKTFDVTINLITPSPTPTPTPPPPSSGGGGYTAPPQPPLAISEIKSPLITTTSLTITWETNFPSSSYVIYSSEAEPHSLDMSDNAGDPPIYGYAHTTAEYDVDRKVSSHVVTITGLNPLEVYYFRTVSRGSLAVSEEYRATTPAVAGIQAAEQESTVPQNQSQVVTDTPDVVPVLEKTDEAPIIIEEIKEAVKPTPISQKPPEENNQSFFTASLSGITQGIFGVLVNNIVLIMILILVLLIIFTTFIIYRKIKYPKN